MSHHDHVRSRERDLIRRVFEALHADVLLTPTRLAARRRRHRNLRTGSLVAAAVVCVVAFAVGADPMYVVDERTASGDPVRWGACAPIRYVVNLRGSNPQILNELPRAISDVERATGLRFVYVGTTQERPQRLRAARIRALYGHDWAPVLIAFAGKADPLIEVPYSTHGVVTRVARGEGDARRYVSGQVVFNADRVPRLPGSAPASLVTRHELGHLVGLGHAPDRDQVMYERPRPVERAGYSQGDLQGLATLGRGTTGC